MILVEYHPILDWYYIIPIWYQVEAYNVFIKHWSKSRKNLGEGLSRLNALSMEVWALSAVSLTLLL
jgi:hypothetical protein